MTLFNSLCPVQSWMHVSHAIILSSSPYLWLLATLNLCLGGSPHVSPYTLSLARNNARICFVPALAAATVHEDCEELTAVIEALIKRCLQAMQHHVAFHPLSQLHYMFVLCLPPASVHIFASKAC